jgi:RHS repeat-associated protein
MAAKGKTLSIALAIVAIFASSPLFASIPRSTVLDPQPVDLLRVAPASDQAIEPEPSLPVFTSENLDQLAGIARIELPRPSISETLERRTSAMLSAYDDARKHRIFDEVSAELASWPLASLEENNIKGERQLSLKLHRATEFQALPFAEPATGLVYARARWYDPETGSFLTPDPMGYLDSSNLYAFCGGDPVNCSDPRGEEGERTGFSVFGLEISFPWGNREPQDPRERVRDGGDVTKAKLTWRDLRDEVLSDRTASVVMMTLAISLDLPAAGVVRSRATVSTRGSVQAVPRSMPVAISPAAPPVDSIAARAWARARESVSEVGEWWAATQPLGNQRGSIPIYGTRARRMSREQRWMDLANEPNTRLPKEVVDFINRHEGKGVAETFGLELAHRPKQAASQGHDYSNALPKYAADHRGIQHRYLKERQTGTTISIPKKGKRGSGKLSLPPPGALPE